MGLVEKGATVRRDFLNKDVAGSWSAEGPLKPTAPVGCSDRASGNQRDWIHLPFMKCEISSLPPAC